MVFHNFDELIAKVKGAPDKKIMAVACANDDHTLEAVVKNIAAFNFPIIVVDDGNDENEFLHKTLKGRFSFDVETAVNIILRLGIVRSRISAGLEGEAFGIDGLHDIVHILEGPAHGPRRGLRP